jgi:hypothetical protein
LHLLDNALLASVDLSWSEPLERARLWPTARQVDTIPSRMSKPAPLNQVLGFQTVPAYWNNPLLGAEYMELRF